MLVLTAGVHVQHDRREYVTLGHGRTETFVLDQRVFWGPVNAPDEPWRELDQFLGQHWRHPGGGILRMDACAIDAGDGATMDRVLGFCQPRLARPVVAVKGAPRNRPAIRASETKQQRLFIVGVDGLKANLVERLRRGRSVRFSDTPERRFFEELASERRVVRYARGVPTASWERIPGRRAESPDYTVYSMAVRGLVQANLDAREPEVSEARAAPARPAVVKWGGWRAVDSLRRIERVFTRSRLEPVASLNTVLTPTASPQMPQRRGKGRGVAAMAHPPNSREECVLMRTYKTTVESRVEKRSAKRLKSLGFKLEKRGDGYAILVYNEVVGAWIEADGLTPLPYSLSLEDVVKLTHEYSCEAEIEELTAA